MSTEITRALKENLAESSVNQAFMVNKGKLVFTEFTQSPKDFVGFIAKILLVNTRNHLKTSIYQAGSTNEGFCYFGI